MRVVPYDPHKKASILADALVVLLSGGTVVYPTETAYGLGGNFFSPRAYATIAAIKRRPQGKPLPVIVPDFRYAATLVRFNREAARLAQAHWPGPLTLVLPLLYTEEWAYHRDPYLGVRVSSHPLAAALALAFGRPLISTSANISGGEPAYEAAAVLEQFRKSTLKPDLIIDAGAIPEAPPSTIVKIDDHGMDVLRKGAIAI